MTSSSWPTEINGNRFYLIESVDSEGNRKWIKFVPVNNTLPMEVANILDQPSKVTWRIRNSHFETIYPNGRRDHYRGAAEAGSLQVTAGTTVLSKEDASTVVVFPLDPGTTMNVQGNTINGDRFTLSVNRDTWVGYISTDGTINPA